MYSFNLNISPKMSYGVLECDIVMLQNYMLYDFVIKYFVIKRGVICAGPCSHNMAHLIGCPPTRLSVPPALSTQHHAVLDKYLLEEMNTKCQPRCL